MDECVFISCEDAFFRKTSPGGICYRHANNGKSYIVQEDKYVLNNNGTHLFKILDRSIMGGIEIIGWNNCQYYVVNEPISAEKEKDDSKLNKFLCRTACSVDNRDFSISTNQISRNIFNRKRNIHRNYPRMTPTNFYNYYNYPSSQFSQQHSDIKFKELLNASERSNFVDDYENEEDYDDIESEIDDDDNTIDRKKQEFEKEFSYEEETEDLINTSIDIIPEETQSLMNKEKETPNILNIALNDPIGKNSTYIKNSFLWKYIQKRDKNIPNEYTTIDLLADLYIEINRYPEILASIFPDRVNRFPEKELSVIWGKYKTFINKWKRLIRDKKQEGFRDEDLELLRINLKRHLGNKAGNCSKIINLYKSGKLTFIEFIDQLTKELGRYSNKIVLTMEELSMILGGYVNFINDILGKINNSSHQRYNPNYKFSIERLDDIKDNILTILLNKAEKCFKIIKKYKDLNPDLKEYKHQQYTIDNPRFFEFIDTILVAYFFGLLWADGYKSSSSYRIGIELSIDDKDRLTLFAESIGFNISRIKDRVRFYHINGVLKSSLMSVLSFVCKDMYNNLDNNQFSEYKKHNIGLPNCILESIRKAKQEAFETDVDWMDTHWGMIALAFLLGFYDGDGTLEKRGNQMSARIYSSNKEFLDQVKEAFEIENDVLTNTEPGEIRFIFGKAVVSRGYYLLTLGVKVFTGMLLSFSDSMQRKRPIEYRNS